MVLGKILDGTTGGGGSANSRQEKVVGYESHNTDMKDLPTFGYRSQLDQTPSSSFGWSMHVHLFDLVFRISSDLDVVRARLKTHFTLSCLEIEIISVKWLKGHR